MEEGVVPQSEPLSADQVQNSAGGFGWVVDDMCRVRRFVFMGAESPTYYVTQPKLAKENATALFNLISAGKGKEVVEMIEKYSVEGRAAKQDPIIFCLAACARCNHEDTKKAAYESLNKILRIPTHLFTFVELCECLSSPKTGWGRAHRKGIANWYDSKKGKNLANHVTKYKQRNGWSHKDMFRLCHIKPTSPSVAFVVKYVVKGLEAVTEQATSSGVSQDIVEVYDFLKMTEDAKTMSVDELCAAIRSHGLVREHIPSEHLNNVEIWKALLEKMPMTAMIRNLGKMTAIKVLEPLSDEAGKVCDMLRNEKSLKDARIHPFNVLLALHQYKKGHGDKGKLKWEPNAAVVSALDAAFYLSFKNVEPTNKRFLLAMDVSGSMTWGECNGAPGITPAVASAAMAMVVARKEPNHCFVGFSTNLVPLSINETMKLDEVIQVIQSVPMGGTDCAQPMIYATQKKLKVDVFIVYTDCETWAGPIHPSEALKKYRAESGIDAKLIVCAMTSNGFTLADPNDPGMLDMAGFDSAAPQVMNEFILGNI
ncbi:predicted protein [Nematostella vectensis]|uniref:RNA-binding protein RO60 n=2 Tax=Nematostella vectensis TaxID=45351 RepID=A7RN19_NEMVE|nr:predicted protein [Nematostella vectensis]|eukprot:XP_001639310.1 predicted protein [Nematostella vectensis]